jgi:hypothetical protein
MSSVIVEPKEISSEYSSRIIPTICSWIVHGSKLSDLAPSKIDRYGATLFFLIL